jgi:hypothetical protein
LLMGSISMPPSRRALPFVTSVCCGNLQYKSAESDIQYRELYT